MVQNWNFNLEFLFEFLLTLPIIIYIDYQMPQNLKKLKNNKFNHLTIILTNINYHKKISQNNSHF